MIIPKICDKLSFIRNSLKGNFLISEKLSLKFDRSTLIRLSITVLFFLAIANNGWGQTNTWDGSASANWNNGANWSLNHVPLATEDVVIPNGITATITVNTAAVCNSFTMNGGGTGNTIAIGGNSLTITNGLTINAPTANITKQITITNGNLTAGSINITSGNNGSRVSQITVTTGTINCNGSISFGGTAASAIISYSGAGTLNITGNFGTGGTFTSGTSTVNFNGSSAQTTAGFTFSTLKSNNPAGITLLAAATASTLTIGDVTSSSIFNDGGYQLTCAGTLNLTSGTFKLGSGAAATTWPAFTTRNISSGTTVEYASGIAQTVSNAPTYQNLTLSGAGAKTAGGSITVNGQLDCQASTFSIGAGNTLTLAGTATRNGAATGTITGSATSDITINGTGDFGTLYFTTVTQVRTFTLNRGGNGIVGIGTDLALAGNFVNTQGILDIGSNTLTLNLNTAACGAGTASIVGSSTSTLSLASPAAAAATLPIMSVGNLTINRTAGATLCGNATVNGTLTLTAGTFIVGANTLTLNGPAIAGTATNLSAGATSSLVFEGSSGSVTIPSSITTLNNLTIGNTSGIGLNSSITVNGVLTLESGLLSLGNYNLTIGAAGSVGGVPSSAAMVITNGSGQFFRTITTTPATYLFPVGDNTSGAEYSPVSLTYSVNNTQHTVGIKVADVFHPQYQSNGAQTDYLTRYWSFTTSGAGTYTYTGTFTYVPADINGTEANIKINRYNTATWYPIVSSSSSNVMTILSSLSETTGPLNGSDFTGRVNPSTTYTWNHSVSTDFTVANNWTPARTSPQITDVLQFNLNETATCINVPTQTVSRIILTNNPNISLQAAAGGKVLTISGGLGNNLDIQNGTTLQLNGANAITLNYLSATQSASIAGTLNIGANGTYDATNSNTAVSGTITNAGTITSTTSNLTFNSGSTYNHNFTTTAGTIPTATWNSNSTLAFIGYTTNANAPSGLNQILGNVTWNCSSQTSNLDLNAGLTSINGNLTMQNTNSGSLRLTTSTTLNPLTIGGNLVLNGGTISLTNGANNATVNVTGNFSIATGATLNLVSAAVAGVGTINLTGNFSMTGGTINELGTATTDAITFAGTSAQTLSKTGGTISNQINFNVLSGAILDMGTSVLDGANAIFTLNSGTTLISGHQNGIYAAGTANGNIQTLTRSYSSTANYTFNYSGAGTQNTGTGFVAGNNITINSTNGTTLTSDAAISGTLTLNQSFNITGRTLTLSGPTIAGTPTNLTTSNTSNLIFNGSSSGVNMPSSVTALNNLTINNSNGVTLNSSIALSAAGVLTLTSGNLILGDYNFTVTAPLGGTYGLGKMIVTNGSGSFIKTGSAVTDFQMIYPVGTNGYFSPMAINTLAATTGSGTVAVRAVASRHSYVPFVNDALMKYWAVSTTGLAGISDARVTFAYNTGEVVGNSSLYVPRIWNGTAFVIPTGTTAAGINPFGTNASGNTILTGEWTAIDPTNRTTFYSYQNGNWNNSNTWTLDPSGQLYDNPSNLTPTASDKAKINTGHTITMPAGLNNQSVYLLNIEGNLDLGSTTGHTFTYLSGSGRIRITNADIFPTTTTNTFFTTDEGIVEYYGNSFNLTTPHNIFHMEVNMTAGQTLTLLTTPYNIAGNLTIKRGTFRINDNSSTTKIRLTVQKDITVASGASFTVGTADMLDGSQTGTGALQYYLVYHSIDCNGNFTNNGTVRFTNQAAPVYDAFTNTGAVSLFMKGGSNNTFTCNGTTDLYNLIIDKGSDKSYILTLYASNDAYFRLFGQNIYTYSPIALPFTQENPELRKALWIRNGTLELTGYLTIPTLNESDGATGGGPNGDFYIPANAALWINGNNVSLRSTARTNAETLVGGIQGTGVRTTNDGHQSFSIYGDLRVSKGFFSTVSHGIVLWYQATTFGSIFVEGGECDLPGIRTATGSTTGKFAFTQTGGLIKFFGDNGNEVLENYASLCIRGTDPTFIMTGGTMEFYDGQAGADNAGTANGGIIRIETNPTNIDVSGGTINIIRNNAGSDNFTIYTTAPFYNLNLTGAAATTLTTNINSAITVKNNLIINDYSTLASNNNNVTIGGNFTLGNTATTNNAIYTAGTNTTTFNGNQNSVITITNTNTATPLIFYNLTLDKTPTSSMSTAWSVTLSSPGRSEIAGDANNHLTIISNDLYINEGKWNNYRYKTRVQRHITNYGTILGDATNTGRITLETGGVQHQLTGSTSVTNSFGDIELNNANGALLNSNISTNNFILNTGIMNINTYNLAVTGTLSGSGGYSTTKMIQSLGSASSQGVTISLSLSGNYVNQDVALVPVGVIGTVSGTGVKYTPLTITLNGNIGAGPYTGTINVRPVDEYHPTGDPNKTSDQIPYYWKTTVTGNLSSITNTMVNYNFGSSYAFNFGGGKFVVYYRNSDWTEGASSNGAPPLSFPSTGFYTTDYSAGKKLAFRNPQYLYSRQSGNWNSTATWSLTGHGVTNPPTTLNSFDVYEIGGFGGVNHQVTVTANTTVASKVIIQGKSVTGISTDPPPSLIVNSGLSGNDFNLVTGGGRIVLNDATFPGGDYLDFAYNDEAIFEYSGGSYTIPSTLTIYPNLWISGNASSVKTSPGANILVRKNLYVGDRTNTGVSLQLNNGANGNITVNDSLVIDNQSKVVYQNSGTARTLTVLKNINCVTGGSSEVNSIEVTSGGSSIAHQLVVQGNIRIGASTMNLYTANSTVDLTLNGESDSRIYNYTGTTMSLNKLIINKSASTYNSIIDKAFSIGAATNTATKPLLLQQGILRINNSSTNVELTSGGGDYTIPSTGTLILDQGTLSVSGNSTGISLNGLLQINGGNFTVYNAANTNNYIQYSATGSAALSITGGALRVGSQIRRLTTTTGGVLNYSQTGGTVDVGYNDAPTASRGVLEILNPGSNFTLTGGTLTIYRGQTGATIPSLYLDPTTSNIGSGMTFTLGGGSGSPQIGIYSSVSIPNIIVSGTGTPTVKMWNVPLSILGNLTINAGGSFDANGLQLNIKGNFINIGTFTHNNNTTVFNGTTTQAITGATTFYNFTKSTSNTLNVNSNIQVSNSLRVESGTLADNGNTIKVLGDVYNVGTITYGGATNSSTQLGIHLNGTVQQAISGTGTFGKITIDNSSGARLPLGSTILINNALRMNQGIFDIQGNLLALGVNCAIEGSGFNAFKMIQTNTSFTDNGIKKTFPAGAETFTYPIGSMGKYTPLTLNITANGNSTGSITLKAASELHPSIVDDAESTCQLNDLNNVLQYYWVLRSNGITGLSGTAQMNCVLSDIKVSNSCGLTAADYITARLLVTSTTWNKFTSDKFDETTGQLVFDFNATDDNGISGDYLCGLDDAIPNTVTVYQTINSGNWTNTSIWQTVPAGGPIPAGGPRGSVVQINPTHTVDVTTNRDVFVYKSYINGTLNLNATNQHRLGYVFGTGTIKVVDQPTLPAGDYNGTDGFITATGGTLEYAGTADYSVLSNITTLNNVKFSGSGNRNLPNNNLQVYGNFTITGPSVYNEYNKDIEIRKDFTMSSGTFSARTSGSPKITLSGNNAQILSGNFTAANSSDLYNLVVNKSSSGVTLSSAVEVSNYLTLTSGNITTTPTNILTLTNPLSTAISGGSSSSYINGPLKKKIDNLDDFNFPIGDGTRFGMLSALSVQSVGTNYYWIGRYFNSAYSDLTTSPGTFSVSNTEYWQLNSPVNGYTATVKLRWDPFSDITPLSVTGGYSDIRVAEYNGTDWVEKTSTNQTNNNYNGTVQTSSSIPINSASNPQFYSLGAVSPILAKARFTTTSDVCQGIPISISFSGVTSANLPYTLSYKIGASAQTPVTVSSLPYSLPTPSSGIYQLTGFAYTTGTGVVDNSTVTVNALPSVPTTAGNSRCDIGEVTLYAYDAVAGQDYLWYSAVTGGTLLQTNGSSFTTPSLLVTTSYWVTIYNTTTGCESSPRTQVTATINTPPAFTITGSSLQICEGNPFTLTTDFTTISTPYTIDIKQAGTSVTGYPLAGQSADPYNYSPNLIYTGPVTGTTYSYSVSVTDNNGCSTSSSVPVTVTVYKVPVTGDQYHVPNNFNL